MNRYKLTLINPKLYGFPHKNFTMRIAFFSVNAKKVEDDNKKKLVWKYVRLFPSSREILLSY